jgi:hypothetical protein
MTVVVITATLALTGSPQTEAFEGTCGASWQAVGMPGIPHRGISLNGVAAASTSDAWAVGSSSSHGVPAPLAEHWDGMAWTIVPLPPIGSEGTLDAVSAWASDDVWAVGTSMTSATFETLTMHWNGTQWSLVPSANGGPGVDSFLWGVTAVAPSDAWAVGSYLDAQGDHRTLAEHWDGAVWAIAPTPNGGGATADNTLQAVSSIGSNDIWAVGAAAGAIAIHWDGSTWTEAPGQVGRNKLRAVVALSGSDVWAAGRGGQVQHWDGTKWLVVASPPTPGQLSGLAALSATDVWAVGEQPKGSPAIERTLIEHWDGQTWNVVGSPNSGRLDNALSAAAATTLGGLVWGVGYSIGQRQRGLAEQMCPPSTVVQR